MRNVTIPTFLASLVLCGCFSPGPDIPAAPTTTTAATATATATATAGTATTAGPGTSLTEVPTTDPAGPPTSSNPGAPDMAGDTITGAASSSSTGEASNSDSTSTTRDPETSGSETSATSTGNETLVCGNAQYELGEDCDDGDGEQLDGCDSSCKRSALFAFVTSQVYAGSALTAIIADEECANLGEALLGPGFAPMKFKAWYSTSDIKGSAAERVSSPGGLPYLRLDLETMSEAPLGKGNLVLPLSVDESGVDIMSAGAACENPESLVWTMTAPNGGVGQQCTGNAKGTVGTLNEISSAWTAACIYDCNQYARLYCIEVYP